MCTESKQRGENEVLRLCLQDVNQPLLGRHLPQLASVANTERGIQAFLTLCEWHSSYPSYTAASQRHQLYAYKDIYLAISQPSSLGTYINTQEFFLPFTNKVHACAARTGITIPMSLTTSLLK